MQLHNLRSLSEVNEETAHRRWCCRASDAWLRAVHTDAAGDFVAEAGAVLERRAADNGAADAECGEMLRYVVRVAHAASGASLSEFPGPMCSPLCKKDAAQLQQHSYTVTEKSDGVRVVVVALWQPRFPAWEVDGDATTTAAAAPNVSHLASVFALEQARRELRRPAAADGADTAPRVALHLHGRRYTMEAAEAPAQSDEAELYSLCPSATTADGAAQAPSLSLRRRPRGRHFAYAVDRSLDAAYLLLDDHTSPQYHTFVLDAELMCVHSSAAATPRLVLGAFDLFKYTAAAEDGVPVNLSSSTMTQRYAALRAVVDTCATPPTDDDCAHVLWYAKDMWAVSDIGACLAKLRYCAASRCFLHDGPFGPTENDGLIFTPDAFPVCAGSSSTQLKWKWRHLLSIDWLLQASDKRPDVYDVSLFFVKKNYGHRDDVAGHWRLRRPMHILNPRGFDMPVDAAVVAECAYDQATQRWYIQRLRHDKLGANSIVTAISVYESLVEDISLPRLLALLRVEAEAPTQLATALESAAAAHVGVAPETAVAEPAPRVWDAAEAEKYAVAKLTLRAIRESRGNTELYLNAFTNGTNKNVLHPLPFPLRKIRDCIGLGYRPDIGSSSSSSTSANNGDRGAPVPSLEDALYIQLANAGGCYAWSDYVVDAFYDGGSGYWEIVHATPRGNNKEAVFDSVVEHLDWVLRHGAAPEAAALLQRRRDAPLIVSRAPRSAATQRTSRHYGAVAKELANAERSDLRRFNNWVKSVLLTTAAADVRRALKPPAKVHAVDLCCGRGGDLLKWQHLRPAFLFMTDAAVECVAEAAARYSTSEGQSTKVVKSKQQGFPAYFAVHDAFDDASGLQRDLAARGPFQLISCQFSMHYGCRSREGMQYFVKAVADSLAPRGRFVGTTVSDAELLLRAKERGAVFGNDVYGVRFGAEAYAQLQDVHFDRAALSFGVPYATTVERSVQDMTEYMVPWDSFVALCAEHHLRLCLEDSLLHYFAEHKDTEAGRAMTLELNRKRRDNGAVTDLPLSPDEVDAVGLYRLFIFEKAKS
ncbi:RNA capping enzyme, nuclear [Novymonas esmeraldas]|uniref:mRNA (guanine-N(7))-methyltransferase n=1 Tax=Novymonas esmeraldas TaxID=1808958 RepID=A0AAW0EQW4_9TRYP